MLFSESCINIYDISISLTLPHTRPFAYFPTQDKFCHAVRFCPTRFRLREGEENPFPFPYRIIFAIATQNSVIIYDTQQLTPFAFLSEIHYTRISDVAWSKDGRLLLISSTDGFCTFVSFTDDELGEVYDGEPFTFPPLCVSPGKYDGPTEPVTPDAAIASAANGTSSATRGKAAKTAPEPIIKTPSVVSFFSKVTKQKRLESMQKELQELDSTPKGNKRKEIAEVTLDDSTPSDNKKLCSETQQDRSTPSLMTPASERTKMTVDHVTEAIDAVAKQTLPSSPPKSEVVTVCSSNGTPVKSEKKPRRINLITLMKPKDKEQA